MQGAITGRGRFQYAARACSKDTRRGTRVVGESCQVTDDRWVFEREARQVFGPNARAQEPRVDVAWIVPDEETTRFDVRMNLFSHRIDERTNHTVLAHRCDARQAFNTGAAQDARENRLSLVVHGVTHRDATRADFARLRKECFVANFARRILNGRLFWHVHAQGVERNAHVSRVLASASYVEIGVRAQAMIDGRDVERQLQLARQPLKHVEHSDGIRPTRARNEHNVTRL